jgi:hypothetical protein
MKKLTLLTISALTLAPFAACYAGAISAGDLLVFQAGTSAVAASNSATTILIDEINPSLTNQTTAVQTFDISTMAAPLYTSKEGSDGDLALSDNGTLLSFSGWTSTNGSAAENLVGGRGAGTLDASGNFTIAATYTGSTTAGNQTRSAYSPDGTNWYFGDKGGVYTQGSTTPLSTSLNTRSIKGFGGTTYALDAATSGPKVVGTITPSTPNGSSYAYGSLSGLPFDNNAVDFTMVSSGNSGAGVYDTLYYTDSTTFTIDKYSLQSGTWVAEGTDSLGSTLVPGGITAEEAPGGGVDIFFTAAPTSGGNVLDEVVDSSAFNSTFSTGSVSTLYTAPTGDDLRGVSLAPQAVPEPASYAALGLGAVLLIAGSRRFRGAFLKA